MQELELRCSDISRKNRKMTQELDQNKERLHDVEKENSRLQRKLTSLTSNLDTTKSRLTNMEWKGRPGLLSSATLLLLYHSAHM